MNVLVLFFSQFQFYQICIDSPKNRNLNIQTNNSEVIFLANSNACSQWGDCAIKKQHS